MQSSAPISIFSFHLHRNRFHIHRNRLIDAKPTSETVMEAPNNCDDDYGQVFVAINRNGSDNGTEFGPSNRHIMAGR
jgi:hypothetical protein